MFTILRKAILLTLTLAVILCGFYPLLVTTVAQIFFHEKANGSLVYKDDKPVGSKLIGQAFIRPEYFHARPSAAGTNDRTNDRNGYDATASSGSNLGPTNIKLHERLRLESSRLLIENPSLKKGSIPVDLVTASASGLDPHISPDAALIQIARVAHARRVDTAAMRQLVMSHVEEPSFFVLGQSRINVLALNIALDAAYPLRAH